MSNRIPFHRQSRSTIQANNPKNPRCQKPFRVSYYKPSEVKKGFATLHVVETMARTAAEAKKKIILRGRKLVSAYKAVGMPKLNKKVRPRRIYTLSPTFAIPPNLRQSAVRIYPVCKLPGCGRRNPKFKRYHTRACARAAKNENQLIAKRKRMSVARRNGIRICHCCAARPIGSFSPTRCNKCFLQSRKLWLPVIGATKQRLRLQEQIPVVMNVLLNSELHRCNAPRSSAGCRIPRCGCRTHATQWLIINAERYAILRRPMMSYIAKGQPLPPWFRAIRPRRNFSGERPGNMLSANQSAMELAV